MVRVVAIFRHFVLLKIMEYSPPAIVFEYLDFEDEEHEEHLGVIVEIQPAEERRVFDPFTTTVMAILNGCFHSRNEMCGTFIFSSIQINLDT